MMVYFNSDYMTGAHPEVMQRLNETNMLHTVGYGEDEYSREARKRILDECEIPEGEVFFLVGGTQTNAAVIDRLIGRNDGVIAADIAHIAVHEAGAIEFSGHKVLTIPNSEGKLQAEKIEEYLTTFYKDESNPHMVRPAMVYISFPTELGTLYSWKELENIYQVCQNWEIPLYIDGARMAYGLGAKDNKLRLKDIARLCDVFYMGGTKCGALFGEAVVTKTPKLLHRFFSLVKMHGGLLAKGRLLGLQFEALFHDGLYYRIGTQAVEKALRLKDIFIRHGFPIAFDSPTNQQFFIVPNHIINSLKSKVSFELWGPEGEKESIIRLVTDWTTTEENINSVDNILTALTDEIRMP